MIWVNMKLAKMKKTKKTLQTPFIRSELDLEMFGCGVIALIPVSGIYQKTNTTILIYPLNR